MNKRARLARRILRDHRKWNAGGMAWFTCHDHRISKKSDLLQAYRAWSCPRCSHRHEPEAVPVAYR